MTREEQIRRARARKRRHQAMIARRITAAVILALILIPVIYGIYSRSRVKSLQKNVNSLEKQLKDSDMKQKQLQKQLKDIQKELKEKEAQLQKQAEATTDNPDKPNVYLTFDDGPSANTDTILDTLEKYNVRATFFCIAREGQENADRYKRIVANGNTLAMHSYTHDYGKVYADLDAFKKDVTGISDFLFQITGVRPKFYRFPGGSSNTVSKVPMRQCINYLNEQGIIYFDWNAQNDDATTEGKDYTAKQLLEAAMNSIHQSGDNVVLLMHDEQTKAETAKALPSLIKKLKSENYDILPITEDTPLVQHVSYK